MNEALTLVEMSHDQYRQAMEDYERKRRSYINALVFAREQGASYAAIGKAVGLTRQRVFTLIKDSRPEVLD